MKAESNLRRIARRLLQGGGVQGPDSEASAGQDETSFGGHLLSAVAVDPGHLALATSLQFGAPLLDLDAVNIDPELAGVVDRQILRKHGIFPIFRRGQKVFLAVSDPSQVLAIDEIRLATGLSVEALVVEADKLQRHLTHA